MLVIDRFQREELPVSMLQTRWIENNVFDVFLGYGESVSFQEVELVVSMLGESDPQRP